MNDLFLESVEESKISEKLAGVCGLRNVNWVTNSSGGFSHEQLVELRLQLSQSFQLIAQNFVIDKTLNHDLRPKSGNPDFWSNQLVSLLLTVVGDFNAAYQWDGINWIQLFIQYSRLRADTPTVKSQHPSRCRVYKKVQDTTLPIRESN